MTSQDEYTGLALLSEEALKERGIDLQAIGEDTVLGRGGFANVYQLGESGEYTAKKLHAELAKDDSLVTRLQREGEVLHYLHQQEAGSGIPYCHGITQSGELILTYVEGQDAIDLGPKIPADTLAWIFLDVATTLEQVHSAGIMHRDIKPANILVHEDGFTTLLDFGIAGPEGISVEVVNKIYSPRLTVTNSIMGSPSFMPPERLKGKAEDRRGDIYSLGLAMYDLVTGAYSSARADPLETYQRRLAQRPAHKMEESVPRYLSDIIEQCRQVNPNDRFSSAQELVNALSDHILEEDSIEIDDADIVEEL